MSAPPKPTAGSPSSWPADRAMRHAPRTSKNDAGRRDAFRAAVDAMSAEALRACLRDWHATLDGTRRIAFEDAAMTLAARADATWRAPTCDPHLSAELGGFVRLARRRGDAEPSDDDDLLPRIGRLFLAVDLATARDAYRTPHARRSGNLRTPVMFGRGMNSGRASGSRCRPG